MSTPSDYYTTLLQTLHQIITHLSPTLTLLPMHPRTIPRPPRSTVRGSLSHHLTCAEEIYKLRLFQEFRDEAVLADVISRLRDGPGQGGSRATDWSTVSDEDWEEEVEELRALRESWVLLLERFSQRIEGSRR